MKTYLLLIIFLPTLLFAQLKVKDKDNSGFSFDQSNLIYGGNFGLYFFDEYSFVEISPTVAYPINDILLLGIGATYIYQDFVVYQYSAFEQKNNIYGFQLFERINITEQIFHHGELNILNYERIDPQSISAPIYSTFRSTIPALNVGIGYSGAFRRGGYIQILYDLLYNPNAARNSSPWNIQIGFNI